MKITALKLQVLINYLYWKLVHVPTLTMGFIRVGTVQSRSYDRELQSQRCKNLQRNENAYALQL
jgi:hypothetical protein